MLLAWLLYNFVGYLVMAIQTPKLYSINGTATFTGMYIMSATYLAMIIVCTIILIVLIKKRKSTV